MFHIYVYMEHDFISATQIHTFHNGKVNAHGQITMFIYDDPSVFMFIKTWARHDLLANHRNLVLSEITCDIFAVAIDVWIIHISDIQCIVQCLFLW